MKKYAATLFAFLLAMGMCFCEESKPNEKPLADVKKELHDGKAILVDVREEEEWKAGHVKDAKLVPLSKLRVGWADTDTLPKDKTIYCYCKMGKRSLAAAAILSGKGYHATSLKEGFDDLSQNGFETSK